MDRLLALIGVAWELELYLGQKQALSRCFACIYITRGLGMS